MFVVVGSNVSAKGIADNRLKERKTGPYCTLYIQEISFTSSFAFSTARIVCQDR